MAEQSNGDLHELEKHQGELIISVALMLGSIWVIYESIVMSIVVYQQRQPDPYTLPGLLPFIAAILILASSARVLVHARRAGATFAYFTGARVASIGRNGDFRVLAIVLGWMAVYVTVLIRVLPFEIATVIFILALLRFYRAVSFWKALVISVLFSGIVTYFFAAVVRTPFPHTFF